MLKLHSCKVITILLAHLRWVAAFSFSHSLYTHLYYVNREIMNSLNSLLWKSTYVNLKEIPVLTHWSFRAPVNTIKYYKTRKVRRKIFASAWKVVKLWSTTMCILQYLQWEDLIQAHRTKNLYSKNLFSEFFTWRFWILLNLYNFLILHALEANNR